MKKRTLLIIILLYFSLLPIGVFANGESFAEIDRKIGEQTEAIKNNSLINHSEKNDKFDELLNSLKDKQVNSSPETNTKEVKENLKRTFFDLSVTARKYSIPLYMLTIIFYIVMATLLGSKSYIKRKGFFFGIATMTLLFIITLNIPIIIIYFQNTPFSEVINADSIYLTIFKVIFFLKENSIALSAIFIAYGIMNISLSKDDIPRRMFGQYLIKASLIMFIMLQFLPKIIYYII